MSAFARQLQFEKILWLGGAIVAFILFSALLVASSYLALFAFGGLLWLVLLPYHSQIAVRLAIATFSSSLIVPFLPGRPPVYEAAALLGWSGLVITLSLRRYSVGMGDAIRRNRWVFIGLAGYMLVLLLLMRQRGSGFMMFGSSQTGGRRYVLQFVCSILPALFAATLPDDRLIRRLFVLQCLLSVTFVAAEFALDHLNSAVATVLYFVDLPWDGVNFLQQRWIGGIRRYQSLSILSVSMLSLVFTFFSLRDLAGRRVVWLGPLVVGLMGMGLLSGHRSFVYLMFFLLMTLAVTERFFQPMRIMVTTVLVALALGLSYTFADSLPQSAQRALYILPGFPAEGQVRIDAQNTIYGRQAVFEASMEIMPEYLLLGRGFGSLGGDASDESLSVADQHVRAGIFYNGPITLLINTGIPGTVCLFVYMGGGLALTLRIIRRLRAQGIHDTFDRACAVLASVWMANLILFLVVAGSPEDAVRSFGLMTGILMACEHNLIRRARELSELPDVA